MKSGNRRWDEEGFGWGDLEEMGEDIKKGDRGGR